MSMDGNVSSSNKPAIRLNKCLVWGLGLVLCRIVWGFVLLSLLGINEGSGPTEPDWLDSLNHYSNLDMPLLLKFHDWLVPPDLYSGGESGAVFMLFGLYVLDTFVTGFLAAVIVQALIHRSARCL